MAGERPFFVFLNKSWSNEHCKNIFPCSSLLLQINYFPSKIQDNLKEADKYAHDPEQLQGQKVRQAIDPIISDFKQAGDRFKTFDAARQERFAVRLAVALSGERIPKSVLETWLYNWEQVDKNLAEKIKDTMNKLKTSTKIQDARVRNLAADEMRGAAMDFLRASGSDL